MSLNAVQVNLDGCNSQSLTLPNYKQMIADKKTTDTVTLSLGGIPPAISTNHYYYSVLNVFEYEGCIRNLRVNGDLRDLKLSANEFNLAQNAAECDCKYLKQCDTLNAPVVRTYEFPWWIILIIIAVLLMLGKCLLYLNSLKLKFRNFKQIKVIILVTLLIIRNKNKKKIPVNNPVELDPLEKENLLLYKTQGGLEKDQVIKWFISYFNLLLKTKSNAFINYGSF